MKDTDGVLVAYPMERFDRSRYDLGETLAGFDSDLAARSSSCPLSFARDPYQLDPTGTLLFLKVFFTHSPSGLGAAFSCHQFTDWVKYSLDKTEDECGSLYAVLCLGSIHSPPKLDQFARICQQRARSHVRRADSYCMPVAQARICFAAYCLLRENHDQARGLADSTLTMIDSLQSCNDATSSNTRHSDFTLTCGQSQICFQELRKATLSIVVSLHITF